MGIWTWLARYERSPLESPDGPVAELHTHRAWHALHVALTGEETGGEPPASHVVWAAGSTMTSAHCVHAPRTVREVASFLSTLDYARVEADLLAARELGMYIYAFERCPGEQDMVESGLFRRVFLGVVELYRAAELGGDFVLIRRG